MFLFSSEFTVVTVVVVVFFSAWFIFAELNTQPFWNDCCWITANNTANEAPVHSISLSLFLFVFSLLVSVWCSDWNTISLFPIVAGAENYVVSPSLVHTRATHTQSNYIYTQTHIHDFECAIDLNVDKTNPANIKTSRDNSCKVKYYNPK